MRLQNSRLLGLAIAFILAIGGQSSAKDTSAQVITWPQTGSPVVRLTLGKIKEITSLSSQHTITSSRRPPRMCGRRVFPV